MLTALAIDKRQVMVITCNTEQSHDCMAHRTANECNAAMIKGAAGVPVHIVPSWWRQLPCQHSMSAVSKATERRQAKQPAAAIWHSAAAEDLSLLRSAVFAIADLL